MGRRTLILLAVIVAVVAQEPNPAEDEAKRQEMIAKFQAIAKQQAEASKDLGAPPPPPPAEDTKYKAEAKAAEDAIGKAYKAAKAGKKKKKSKTEIIEYEQSEEDNCRGLLGCILGR